MKNPVHLALMTFIGIIFWFSGNIASAETVEYNQFMTDFRTPATRWTAIVYISGVTTAFMYANVTLSVDGKPLLYCQPSQLALSPEQMVAIMTSYVREAGAPSGHSVADVMLTALKGTFPCPKE
jgi:hypothetical protein